MTKKHGCRFLNWAGDAYEEIGFELSLDCPLLNYQSMKINSERLARGLTDLAGIGALPGGGVERLAFSALDRAGREYVAERLSAIGLEPKVDAIGNLFCVRPAATATDDRELSQEPGDPGQDGVVFLGSHTDTVANAGRYDGSLGVLAALEVLTVLQENGVRTRFPTGLISFVNEEGVRFMPDMMGSLYVRGDLSLDALLPIVGTDGLSIGEALRDSRMAGQDSIRAYPIRAFVEVHIEQGSELEARNASVAAVTGVQGLSWMEVHLTGRANHAGTTPMTARADCALVAGQIIQEVRQLTQETQGLRGTVGRVELGPNLVNVIPGRATLTVDLRHPEQTMLESAVRKMRGRIELLANHEGLGCRIRETASAPAVQFDPLVVDAVTAAVSESGLGDHTLISGAGHDAQIMASAVPSGMIFVRSRDGISHNPAEYSSPADCAAGAAVLLGATLRLASVVS